MDGHFKSTMKIIATISMLLVLSACTTVSSPSKPSTGKALVTVQSDPATNILALVQKTMRIKSINGSKVSNFFHSETSSELTPGLHTLIVECTVIAGQNIFAGEKEISIDAQPGHSYEFFIESLESHTCSIGLNVDSSSSSTEKGDSEVHTG